MPEDQSRGVLRQWTWAVLVSGLMVASAVAWGAGVFAPTPGLSSVAPSSPSASHPFAASPPVSAEVPAATSCSDCVLENISIPINPSSIGYDGANNNLYVGDENAAALTIISGASNTVTGIIPVGTPTMDVPRAVAVDTANNELYVPNDSGTNVTVVNATTDTTVASVTVKTNPFSAAYDSSNGYVYVGEQGITTAWITVINGATHTVVKNISLGPNTGQLAEGLAVDTANGELYAGNGQGNNITVVSLSTDAIIGSIEVGDYPASLALDSANNELYAANTQGENISVVATATNSPVKSIAVNTSMLSVGPTAVAYDAATGCVYAPSGGGNWVSIIDTRTDALIGTIPIQGSPTSVVVDPTNGEVYVPYINPTLTASYVAVLAVADCPSSSVLASVSVTPLLGEILLAGGSSVETATPTCNPAPCPGAVSYEWSINNASLAHLSSPTTNPTSVIAGGTSGALTVYVNASLNGFTVGSSASVLLVISGSAGPGPNGSGSPGFLDLPGAEGAILIGALAIVAVAAAVIVYAIRRGGARPPTAWPPPLTPASPPPYSPSSPPPPPPPPP